MFQTNSIDDVPDHRGLYGTIRKSISRYGVLRWILTIPVIIIYSVSYSFLSPEYKTPNEIFYEELNKRIAAEKSEITSPVNLSSEFFYYSSLWQEKIGENPVAHTLVTESLEYLFKSMNFLKDIQSNNEDVIKKMIQDKMSGLEQSKIEKYPAEEIYLSISNKGEYFTRLFHQLFSQHGLKKLGTNYSDTDVEVFFNMLNRNPQEKQFRQLLGALVLNVPYYLVIKNSINEYYQNNDILIPVDLFSFTLFMMYLDEVKSRLNRPSIEECRAWVFSVIVPDEGKRKELQTKPFSVQEIIREEMIMPNPGFFSKGYNEKKHKAIDIASGRGTMIRSPLTGTVQYYEKSPKIQRTGNFIIIKDEKSNFNIFICHMDDKDYIEEHSTEGELAEPIANLTPDWIHPLKKGQFFEVVGNKGKSTGAHTHIQIAQRIPPYRTFDFLSVNKGYEKKFNSYLKLDRYWPVYSRNEDLLQSVFAMMVSHYDSTRHFSDRDPAILELYKLLQKNYKSASVTIDPIDIVFEKIPHGVLRTYFSRSIQEKIINERYEDELNYYGLLILQLNHHMKQVVPLAETPPERAIPLTPWQIIYRRRPGNDEESPENEMHERSFYRAINTYFLYKILQLNDTPKEIRDQMLADSSYTGNTPYDLPDDLPLDHSAEVDHRTSILGKYVQRKTHLSIDFSFINKEDFCSAMFTTMVTACKMQGFPLDYNFGFFRYDIDDLQHQYQTSKFIHFSDTREFIYNEKYNNAIKLYCLETLELAADEKRFDIFRELYNYEEEVSISILSRISQKIRNSIAKRTAAIRFKLFGTPYPIRPEIPASHIRQVFQKLIENIVKPVPYESREYAGTSFYRAAETSIFYSLIYEVYCDEREQYMQFFPEDQLSKVMDAIGLFDSMFKVFCDNAVQKDVIDKVTGKIIQELESAEKELGTAKETKQQLQNDFKKETETYKKLHDYINKQAELFSNYLVKEEEINRKIVSLEQSIDRYRNECSMLKQEKSELQKIHEAAMETMISEIDALRSQSRIERDRFRIEMMNVSYHKEKATREAIELKVENDTLKKKMKDLGDAQLLLKKYQNVISVGKSKDAEQDKIVQNLNNELNRIKKSILEFKNSISAVTGIKGNDMSLEDIGRELLLRLNSPAGYRDQSATVKLFQEQQKNDKRSLMLNAQLINDMKQQIEKLEIQLQYLIDTTVTQREKELEEENNTLLANTERLKEEIRSLRKLISKSK